MGGSVRTQGWIKRLWRGCRSIPHRWDDSWTRRRRYLCYGTWRLYGSSRSYGSLTLSWIFTLVHVNWILSNKIDRYYKNRACELDFFQLNLGKMASIRLEEPNLLEKFRLGSTKSWTRPQFSDQNPIRHLCCWNGQMTKMEAHYTSYFQCRRNRRNCPAMRIKSVRLPRSRRFPKCAVVS